MSKKVAAQQHIRYIKKSNIVMGTLILTLSGFIIRFIGFFYRIFLSNTMGAELMGIYQLIFPVYGIAFTIYASGIQTSISRLVAREIGRKNPKNIIRILRIGILMSVSLAAVLTLIIYFNADFIAWRILMEKRCADSLRILAVVFPFCGVTACINGYYYGLKKTGVPAATQLLEQLIRVIIVYFIALYFGGGKLAVTCEMAVVGLVAGEIASCLYNFASMFITKSPAKLLDIDPNPNVKEGRRKLIIKDLLSLSVPLSANRLLLSILHSIEAILIPSLLRRSGLSNQDALVAFGVLNGMSIPFILFPTAITNALSVLLLPTISEAQAVNNDKLIGITTAASIKYSLIIGIISTGVFVYFGNDLGNAVFHNVSAGEYLMVLAWLCPFLYLTTTLGSVINGLGKAHITFINSIIGTVCKIFLIIFLIPARGINGYLIALLIGQLIITGLDTFAVIRNVHFSLDSINSVVKPGIFTAICGFFLKESYEYTKKMIHMNDIIFLLIFCLLLCIICTIFLWASNAITKNDFK